jgi:hypothetical protein
MNIRNFFSSALLTSAIIAIDVQPRLLPGLGHEFDAIRHG